MKARLVILTLCCMTQAAAGVEARLVILKETGSSRDGLPVLALHDSASKEAAGLSRGFSARMLRLYSCQQNRLKAAGESGRPLEPAYLLLSGNQGGFPRFGFYLGEQDKREAAYVDLIESGDIHGRFGSDDQIFPHELAHIILRRLAGPPPRGGANQVHAVGLRTDPYVAFDEGFAEHIQIMAIEDEDAEPSTRALASDGAERRTAAERMAAYRHELRASWSPAGPMRMGFLTWFSPTEQVLRYHSVKANAFVRQPNSSSALSNPYLVYLEQGIVPGEPGGGLKSVPVMLSTEGVVAAFFYRLVSAPAVRNRYLGADFYRAFGVTREEVQPVENAYLKICEVFYSRKTRDLREFIDGYKASFPEEAQIVDDVCRGVFGQLIPPASPEIWLANRDFQTGTTLFDQYRGVPRPHTFDLNAASSLDLITVPGVDRGLADAILRGAPYRELNDLRRAPGMTPALLKRFVAMSDEMVALRLGVEEEAELDLKAIVMPYVWRALAIWLVASAVGALILRFGFGRKWRRCLVNAAVGSLVGLLVAWITFPGGPLSAAVAPMVVFGFPAAIYCLLRRRGWRQAALAILTWAASALPAAALVHPWF